MRTRGVSEIQEAILSEVVNSQCGNCASLYPHSEHLCHLKELTTDKIFEV